jgi:hypothetical protein
MTEILLGSLTVGVLVAIFVLRKGRGTDYSICQGDIDAYIDELEAEFEKD